MSDDKRSGGGGRKPPFGPKRPSGSGAAGGKRPFGAKPGGFRSRAADGDAPPRRSFRDRPPAGEAPARSPRDRTEGEERPRRTFRDRQEGRASGAGEERPQRASRGEDAPRKPYRKREDGPARFARGADGPRKPFRASSDRPARPSRGEDGPRRSFGDRDDRPRFARDADSPRKPGRRGVEGAARPSSDEAAPRRSVRDRPDARSQDRPFRPFRRDDSKSERPFQGHRDGGGRFRDRDENRGDRDGGRPYRTRPFEAGDAPRRQDDGEPGRRQAFEPRFEERRETRPDRRPERGPRPPSRSEPRRDGDRKEAPRKPYRDDKPFKDKAAFGDRAPAAPRSTPVAATPVEAPKRPPAAAEASGFEGERVAKVIARAGLGSRRDAEVWIEEGRVAVNGEILTQAARNVTQADAVTVDGNPLPKRERTRLWLYHKPRGLVTTEKDPEGRPTVFEHLPDGLPRVLSIGRLDINTEGLLLLTNDGGLARMLELPKTGWLRRYRVRAHGETDQTVLDNLFEGVTIDGVDYGRIEARLDKEQGTNSWLTLGLREGKNREVKTVLASIGLDVNRLIRVSYGPFQLGELAEGAVEEISTRILVDQLGAALIEEAGCEFEAPIFVRGEDAGPTTRVAPAQEPHAPRAAEPKSKRRGLRVKAEDGEADRVMRGGLIEDRRGRRVLVQRVADVEDERGGGRPARPAGDRPFKPRARSAEGGGDRPFKPRARSEEGGGDRPFKPRARSAEGGGDRPFKPRARSAEGGDRPFKPRARSAEGGGDRPFKPRARSEEGGGDRPFKPRARSEEGGGDRPFKPRARSAEGGDRPFKPRARSEEGGGDRPFKPRARPGGGSSRPPIGKGGGRPPGRPPRRGT